MILPDDACFPDHFAANDQYSKVTFLLMFKIFVKTVGGHTGETPPAQYTVSVQMYITNYHSTAQV